MNHLTRKVTAREADLRRALLEQAAAKPAVDVVAVKEPPTAEQLAKRAKATWLKQSTTN